MNVKIATAHPIERENMQNCFSELQYLFSTKPIEIIIDQVYRSIEESNLLFSKGRNAIGAIVNQAEVVSNARGGKSWHNYGLAWDIHIKRNGKDIWFDTTKKGAESARADVDYNKIIGVMAKYGYSWGGDFQRSFRDVPHFENQRGQNISDLYRKYATRDFITGTNYVNI